MKKVSILLPTYNSEAWIKDCLDSVFGQSWTNFEIVIVDDHSIDKTVEIIESYGSSKIKLTKRDKHSGIATALNSCISNSTGDFLVRMDADDIMFPDRLQYQVEWMNSNPDVDIAGMGIEWMKTGNGPREVYCPQERIITKNILMTSNPIQHSTVIMRTKSIQKLPYIYEQYYSHPDLKLWFSALTHGLVIKTTGRVVNLCRQHPNQYSVVHEEEIQECDTWIRKSENFTSGGILTCILTGRNEKYEVEKTMASIRGTAREVKIIFVDDGSDDGYDYKSVCIRYGALYHRNNVSAGVAGSREVGIGLCDTRYFLILDSHMRFYNDDWDVKLIEALEDNPNSIICSNTVVIWKNPEATEYDNEDGHNGKDSVGHGCFVNMWDAGNEYSGKWTSKFCEPEDGRELMPIPCVMGAVYATSKTWWNWIGGLQGLKTWGYDEPLMSIKTWMAGGKCLIMKSWGVGHVYRDRGPFRLSIPDIDRNQLYLVHLFTKDPEKIKKYEDNIKKRLGSESAFKESKRRFEADREEFEKFKQYFYDNVAKVSFDDFMKMNKKAAVNVKVDED